MENTETLKELLTAENAETTQPSQMVYSFVYSPSQIMDSIRANEKYQRYGDTNYGRLYGKTSYFDKDNELIMHVCYNEKGVLVNTAITYKKTPRGIDFVSKLSNTGEIESFEKTAKDGIYSYDKHSKFHYAIVYNERNYIKFESIQGNLATGNGLLCKNGIETKITLREGRIVKERSNWSLIVIGVTVVGIICSCIGYFYYL